MTMKTFKRSTIAISIALAALTAPAHSRDDLGNCYAPITPYLEQIPNQEPERGLYVLIDQTVKPDGTLKTEVIKRTLEYLRQGDRITVVTFSAYAKKHYTKIVFTGTMERALPDQSFAKIPIKKTRRYKTCLKKQNTAGRKAVMASIYDGFTSDDDKYDYSNTELIGALNTISADLIQKSTTKERTLLVFSDMLENSELTSFFKKGEMRLLDANAELNKVKRAGMIPDLKDINIYVIGAGWLEDGSLYQDSRRIKTLRAFWEKFFAASGANLQGFGEPMLLVDLK